MVCDFLRLFRWICFWLSRSLTYWTNLSSSSTCFFWGAENVSQRLERNGRLQSALDHQPAYMPVKVQTRTPMVMRQQMEEY
jgi:hypothetical protein